MCVCGVVVQGKVHEDLMSTVFLLTDNLSYLSIEMATRLNIDDVEQITSIAI